MLNLIQQHELINEDNNDNSLNNLSIIIMIASAYVPWHDILFK